MGVPDAPEHGDVIKAPGVVPMLFQTLQNSPRRPPPQQTPSRLCEAFGRSVGGSRLGASKAGRRGR